MNKFTLFVFYVMSTGTGNILALLYNISIIYIFMYVIFSGQQPLKLQWSSRKNKFWLFWNPVTATLVHKYTKSKKVLRVGNVMKGCLVRGFWQSGALVWLFVLWLGKYCISFMQAGVGPWDLLYTLFWLNQASKSLNCMFDNTYIALCHWSLMKFIFKLAMIECSLILSYGPGQSSSRNVHVYICPLPLSFISRPLIGPEITLPVQGLSLVNPPTLCPPITPTDPSSQFFFSFQKISSS